MKRNLEFCFYNYGEKFYSFKKFFHDVNKKDFTKENYAIVIIPKQDSKKIIISYEKNKIRLIKNVFYLSLEEQDIQKGIVNQSSYKFYSLKELISFLQKQKQ